MKSNGARTRAARSLRRPPPAAPSARSPRLAQRLEQQHDGQHHRGRPSGSGAGRPALALREALNSPSHSTRSRRQRIASTSVAQPLEQRRRQLPGRRIGLRLDHREAGVAARCIASSQRVSTSETLGHRHEAPGRAGFTLHVAQVLRAPRSASGAAQDRHQLLAVAVQPDGVALRRTGARQRGPRADAELATDLLVEYRSHHLHRLAPVVADLACLGVGAHHRFRLFQSRRSSPASGPWKRTSILPRAPGRCASA